MSRDDAVLRTKNQFIVRGLPATRRHCPAIFSLALFVWLGFCFPSPNTWAQPPASPVTKGGSSAGSKDFQPAPIRVPEGFTVDIAAAPPLVRHPITATFDDQGRLYVCENAGVNLTAEELEKQLPNSIRQLRDTDGDGKFDRATVFADKMTFPMGAAWYRGSLYVASPPYIWRLQDTDDDGVADRREILVQKFGYTGNAASIHGCFLGPDGRLYWCDGYHGHEFRDESDQVTRREGSYIFSCRPDGSDLQIHCGGGMDNPVEVDFTNAGEMLGTVNIMYTRPRVDCLVHWLYGGTYPHRERILAERQVTGGFLGPAHRFGHVAVSGMLRYRSGSLNPRWRNDLFVTFFNTGKVVRLEPNRTGATYRATQREFLTSSSREFHPTDVTEDADGSLLVIDTGGWFYRGCPTSQFAKPDIQGAIYRVRRTGMPTPVDPRGNKIPWEKLTHRERNQYLGDPRWVVRQRAMTESAARGTAAVPQLRQSLKRGDTLTRLGALWSLSRIAGQVTSAQKKDVATGSPQRLPAAMRDAFHDALADRSLDIRVAACHCLALFPDRSSLAALNTRLQTDVAPIRRVAAKALGRIGDPTAVPALLKSLTKASDDSEEHAIIYALIEIDQAPATARGLQATSARVRRGALIALDQMDSKYQVTQETIFAYLQDSDERLRDSALQILQKNSSWFALTAPMLQTWLSQLPTEAPYHQTMREILGFTLQSDAVSQLVGEQLSDPDLPSSTRSLLLTAIAQQNKFASPASWSKPLDRLLASDNTSLQMQAVAAIAALKSDQFNARLSAFASDADQPAELRLAAVEAIARKTGRLTPESFSYVCGLVDAENLVDAQQRSVRVLSQVSLSAEQMKSLLPLLQSAGPVELRELIRPYLRSSDRDLASAFLETMSAARSFGGVPSHEFSDIIKRYPQELLPRANQLLQRLRDQQQEKLDRVDDYLANADSGDPVRGREVFFSEKAKCATCHRVGSQGDNIGPDLTTIGANRSARDLLESILFPSATLVRQYEPYVVALDDGRVLTGLIARETSELVVLQPATGKPIVIPRSQIEQIQSSMTSIMPSGMESVIDRERMIDLVQFLLSCRAQTPSPSATSEKP